MGRATQGVRVMNMKADDRVSAVALVVEDSDAQAAAELEAEQLEAGLAGEASPNGDAAAEAGEAGGAPGGGAPPEADREHELEEPAGEEPAEEPEEPADEDES